MRRHGLIFAIIRVSSFQRKRFEGCSNLFHATLCVCTPSAHCFCHSQIVIETKDNVKLEISSVEGSKETSTKRRTEINKEVKHITLAITQRDKKAGQEIIFSVRIIGCFERKEHTTAHIPTTVTTRKTTRRPPRT